MSLFVLLYFFLFAIVLSVHLRFTDSEHPFLYLQTLLRKEINLLHFIWLISYPFIGILPSVTCIYTGRHQRNNRVCSITWNTCHARVWYTRYRSLTLYIEVRKVFILSYRHSLVMIPTYQNVDNVCYSFLYSLSNLWYIKWDRIHSNTTPFIEYSKSAVITLPIYIDSRIACQIKNIMYM